MGIGEIVFIYILREKNHTGFKLYRYNWRWWNCSYLYT